MSKLSCVLKNIMLGIVLAVLVLTFVTVIVTGLDNISYLVCLAAGLSAAAVFLLVERKVRPSGRFAGLAGKRSEPTGLVLMLLCVAASLAWSLKITIQPFSDYAEFWNCACCIASGQPVDRYFGLFPHLLGYASFLSLFLRLFGQNLLVPTLLSAVLSGLSALLVYYIVLKLTDKKCAVLAALFWTLWPCRIMESSLVFSEPLYTFLLLLFLFLLLRIYEKQDTLKTRFAPVLLLGALLGAILRSINIIRPISVIVIIAFAIWLFLLRGEDLKDGMLWRFWLLFTAAMLVVYFLTGRLWNAELVRILGQEPPGVPWYNIYVGINPKTDGMWSMEDMALLESYYALPGYDAVKAQESMIPHILERLHSGEIDFGRLLFRKLFFFLGNDEIGGYTYRYTRSELFVKLCILTCNCFYYFILTLSVPGTVRLFRNEITNPAVLLMPLYVLGLTLAHMIIEVSNRYHYSAIPMLIMLAAFAFFSEPEPTELVCEGGIKDGVSARE